MDADGLPIIGAGIDYTKVGAIQQKRTLAYINFFVSHTARFLNRFSCVCEEKLADIANRIQRLENTTSILEAKLSSIPGLENVTVAASTEQTPASASKQQENTTQSTVTAENVQHTQSVPQHEAPPTAPEPPPVEQAPQAPQMTVSKDPRYTRFFQMLKVGVPLPAVKLKAQVEGLDPELLETPDAPAPPSGGTKNDSDDDFSDGGDSDSSGFSD